MSLANEFILAVFRPSKNAMPKGIRSSVVKPLKGRRVARVNQWNKLPGWKQEIIRVTGNRDRFLRGEITYAESKRELRNTGVARGILKPVRQRATKNNNLQRAAGHHVFDLAMDSESERVSPLHIAENARHMSDQQAQKALGLRTPQELQHEALWHPRYMPREDRRSIWSYVNDHGVEVNLLWYH